ncbi:hypothetical protein OAT18_01240 [Tenacibaculum sp.]|nr:hypothetical protein [Tenacibaculum sp.]
MKNQLLLVTIFLFPYRKENKETVNYEFNTNPKFTSVNSTRKYQDTLKYSLIAIIEEITSVIISIKMKIIILTYFRVASKKI